MAIRRLGYLLLLGATISTGALADEYGPCSHSKELVGVCWDIRGRVSLYNGNPSVRIWPVGTKRILGVREADPQLLPPDLAKRLSWQADVFADLRVCPLTKEREGTMQIVCVAAAGNMVSRPR